jgi:hypothetical protein
VVAQLLGERQRRTSQAGDPLSQRTVEAFDMMSLAGQLGDSAVLGWGNDTRVNCLVIRREHSVLLICNGNLFP